MDIQAYISSGKLELFVLGELSEREREEVLEMAKKHPQVKKELEEIETAMFAFDNQSGPKPSSAVKAKIFETLDNEVFEEKIDKKKNTTTPVVPLQPWKTYAAAASIVALIASVLAIYFASRYYQVDSRLTALIQDQAVMAEEVDQYKVRFQEADAQLETLLAGDFDRIPMTGEGFEIQQDARVDVFWDKNKQEVWISVNNLSSIDEDKDYQLWAIGEDGPLGIGLVSAGEKLSLQQMKAVSDAGAFAITIEPKGGSESPTLENLVVIGEVA
ncbi:anti-sigma factor [Pararhodonellum marinum]|uniref:anti-sigma factor n=1 Tax=Pararhodonellum marinum TaxID=2755358 RepID=UPI00188F626F|nr:anti-sigma factor [Pararhodonellum marinum]